jgi:hypothetical protein
VRRGGREDPEEEDADDHRHQQHGLERLGETAAWEKPQQSGIHQPPPAVSRSGGRPWARGTDRSSFAKTMNRLVDPYFGSQDVRVSQASVGMAAGCSGTGSRTWTSLGGTIFERTAR